jgi:hypothetical protein
MTINSTVRILKETARKAITYVVLTAFISATISQAPLFASHHARETLIDLDSVNTVHRSSARTELPTDGREEQRCSLPLKTLSPTETAEEKNAKIQRVKEEIAKNPSHLLRILVENHVDYSTAEELLYQYAPAAHEKLSEAYLINTGRYNRSIFSSLSRFAVGFAFDILAVEYFQKTEIGEAITKKLTRSMFAGVNSLGEYLKDLTQTSYKPIDYVNDYLVDILGTLAKVELFERVPVSSMVQSGLTYLVRTGTEFIKNAAEFLENKLFRSYNPALTRENTSKSSFEAAWIKFVENENAPLKEFEQYLNVFSNSAHSILDNEGLVETNKSSTFQKYFWKSANFLSGLSLSFLILPVAGAWIKPIVSSWLHGKIGVPLSDYIAENYYYQWALGKKVTNFVTNGWNKVRGIAGYISELSVSKNGGKTFIGHLVNPFKSVYQFVNARLSSIETIPTLDEVREKARHYGTAVMRLNGIEENPYTGWASGMIDTIKDKLGSFWSWVIRDSSEDIAKKNMEKLESAAHKLKLAATFYYDHWFAGLADEFVRAAYEPTVYAIKSALSNTYHVVKKWYQYYFDKAPSSTLVSVQKKTGDDETIPEKLPSVRTKDLQNSSINTLAKAKRLEKRKLPHHHYRQPSFSGAAAAAA